MNNTLKPFLKIAAEPVRKAIELKPVKATKKELSDYAIKAPSYTKWLTTHAGTSGPNFVNTKYDAKVIPAQDWATWLKAGTPTNKSKYSGKAAATAAYNTYFGDIASKAYKQFADAEEARAKRTPSIKDTKQLALTDLITKYPGKYTGASARSDAALSRIDATGNTDLYKKYTTKANQLGTIQGKPTEGVNKDLIIELRHLLNSDEFAGLPDDVKEQMIEDNYGGALADLTKGGTSVQELMNMLKGGNEGGDEGAFGTGQVDPIAQSMYSKSYTPGSSSSDPRFGQEAAKDIAAIKSERESMKEHDKEKAYRYMNPSAGEYAQTYDNPADQKVYQDQVNKLRTAMKKLGPIVQDNAGLQDYDSFNVYNKNEAAPKDWDRFNVYGKNTTK